MLLSIVYLHSAEETPTSEVGELNAMRFLFSRVQTPTEIEELTPRPAAIYLCESEATAINTPRRN
ncbi:hypothetical protein [Lysinibacillus sp. fls2-241-R2A-57]|uniref:hypothetical protein n=1 Tax=Lysinibacillus sp. fls2-241-R2A-57 TaxID=3040292 RepID=UPI002555863B|nr:hypothetical protein [Lysinibacillus sp. fls2-241-R2A-57]